MSSFMRPVGSKPAHVYWRRRLVVMLALIAVVVVVVLLIVRPGSGAASEPGSASGASTDAAGSAGNADGTAGSDTGAQGAGGADSAGSGQGATGAPTPSPSETAPVAEPAAVQACTPDQLRIEALTDATSYGSGVAPMMALSMTNTGGAACTINGGTAKQVYTISSGSEVYWRSTDCQIESSDTTVRLEPGQTAGSAPFGWDRTRSSTETCDVPRDTVPAGGASYHLTVSVDGIESTVTKQFILE